MKEEKSIISIFGMNLLVAYVIWNITIFTILSILTINNPNYSIIDFIEPIPLKRIAFTAFFPAYMNAFYVVFVKK